MTFLSSDILDSCLVSTMLMRAVLNTSNGCVVTETTNPTVKFLIIVCIYDD